jgi:hypothetical protein
MEYFIVIVLTSAMSLAIIKVLNKLRTNALNSKYTQSYIYEMIKDVIPKNTFNKGKIVTQSQKHIQKNMLKVVITDGMAYWMVDNIIYTASATNGRIDESSAKQVDIDSMSKEDVFKMLSIIDDLKKGNDLNDSGSTGDKRV